MTTKQRNKSLKSPTVIIKNKTTQNLSPVEKELLEFYEKDQPVLLYGNDGLDLEKLVKRIERVYYAHNSDIGTGELIKAFENLFPLRYIDCGDMNGKEVYEALIGRPPLEGGYLFKEHGVLIIDNLHCDRDKDERDYRELAKIIKDRQIEHLPTKFNWLVARAHDPEPFPTYFKNQFELCLLDGELKESIKISRINALKHIGKEPKTVVEPEEEKAEKSLPEEESRKQCIFQKRDDVYIILYAHESFTLQATDGLKYIRHLLGHPYDANAVSRTQNKFTPNQLFIATQKRLPYDVGKRKYKGYDIEPFSANEEMMTFEDHMFPETDEDQPHGEEPRDPGCVFKGGTCGDYTEEIIGDTKRELQRLAEEKQIAKMTRNKEKVDRIQADINEIKREYAKYHVGGGKSRKFVSSLHKKPYDNIVQARDIVYEKIKKHSEEKGYNSMLTWKHLSSSIKFKNSCFFYEPEKLPDWTL